MKKLISFIFSMLIVGHALAQSSFGRLFFSPEQRRQFDTETRQAQDATVAGSNARTLSQRFSGQITRGKAHHKVGIWINGQLSDTPLPPSVQVGDTWQSEGSTQQGTTQSLLPKDNQINADSTVRRKTSRGIK